ncbi:MAG: hypothetical protein R6U58_02925 [Bacteroidales bacterium]
MVVEEIGCSPVFEIGINQFSEPFKVAMQDMFYQRMGCEEKPAGDFPDSCRPLFKQGIDSESFKVYISKKNMVTGENPDNRKYYSEELKGEIVKASWVGWSNAYDNGQRPWNFICPGIYFHTAKAKIHRIAIEYEGNSYSPGEG